MEYLLLIAISVAIWGSCSTGIESTKKIRMTKEDVKQMAKSAEQDFAESLEGTPLSSWENGKKFMALSDRSYYIFEPTGIGSSEASRWRGRELTFEGLDRHINPDLSEECVIVFSDGERMLRYRTGKPTQAALKETDSSKLPLISDLELIGRWKAQLSGRTLWTKSNLWYDSDGQRKPGLKFAKVIVEDVEPATGDFPMKVRVRGGEDEIAYLQMNYTSEQHDSRNFAAVFFLSDPRGRYPQISDEHWAQIQRGLVAEGMTKEECKLAIGNPDEVRAGHNRSQTMDIWQYTDGTYLMFTDGLLTHFRQ